MKLNGFATALAVAAMLPVHSALSGDFYGPEMDVFALEPATNGVSYYQSLHISGGGKMFYDDDSGEDYYKIAVSNIPPGLEVSWSAAGVFFLEGTPGDDADGDYEFTVYVSDADAPPHELQQRYTLTVQPYPNLKPVIDDFQPKERKCRIEPDQNLPFSVTYSDPDGDELVCSWTVLDSAGVPVPGYSEVLADSISFSVVTQGWYDVEVRVTDGKLDERMHWSVLVAEAQPLAGPDGDPTELPGATACVPYTENLGFSGGKPIYDEKEDCFFFETEVKSGNLPNGIRIENKAEDASGIVLSGTPGDDAVGNHEFTVGVTDADGVTVERRYAIAVAANTNRPPEITSSSPKGNDVSMCAGNALTFSVTASDPDGDGLDFRWTAFDGDSGVASTAEGRTFTFSRTIGQAGEYTVMAEVSDSNRSVSREWRVHVTNACFIVTFDANGGTGGTTATLAYGSPLSAPTVVRPGYSFAGWSPEVPETVRDGNAKYVAKWTAVSQDPVEQRTDVPQGPVARYNVKFLSNGGRGKMSVLKMTYGKKKKLPANKFKKKGLVFAGWSTKKNGPVVYANKAAVKDLTDKGGTVRLHAVWAKPAYKVKFLANGGTGAMPVQSFKYGKAAKLKANGFKKKDCVFKGWATSKSNAGKGVVKYKNKKKVKNLVTTGKTVKLYAVWKKKGYTVVFNPNGGTGTMANRIFPIGKTVKLPANKFKMAGFAFAGWATSKAMADLGKTVYVDMETVKNLAELGKTADLYAVWEAPELCFSKDSASWPSETFLSSASDKATSKSKFSEGDDILLCAGYSNSGALPTGNRFKVSFTLLDSDRNRIDGFEFTQEESLAPASERIVSWAWVEWSFLQSLPAGQYVLRIELDAAGEIAEKNENDNVRELAFSVVSAGG